MTRLPAPEPRLLLALALLMAAPDRLPAEAPFGASSGRRSDEPTPLERAVLDELNLVRRDPPRYARELERLRERFDGRRLVDPETKVVLLTQEGGAAVDEAIAVLRRTPPRGLLQPSRGLALAARAHASDQAKTGDVGHDGSDRSTPSTRAGRFGTWHGVVAENIHYGSGTARDVVIGLLVDDGVPSRGHRANILDPRFTVAGVSEAIHPSYRRVCVIDFAGGYSEAAQGGAVQPSPVGLPPSSARGLGDSNPPGRSSVNPGPAPTAANGPLTPAAIVAELNRVRAASAGAAALVQERGIDRAASQALSERSSGDGRLSPGERLSEFGTWSGSLNEILSCSGAQDASSVVDKLLGGGDATKAGYREALLDGLQRKVGVAVATDAAGRTCVLVDIVTDFRPSP